MPAGGSTPFGLFDLGVENRRKTGWKAAEDAPGNPVNFTHLGIFYRVNLVPGKAGLETGR